MPTDTPRERRVSYVESDRRKSIHEKPNVSSERRGTMDRRPTLASISDLPQRRGSVAMGPGGLPNMGRRRSLYPQKPEKSAEQLELERKKLALDRFRKAVFKVKAMIRFGLAPKLRDEEADRKNMIRYQNTYKMEPDNGNVFKPEKTASIIMDVIKDNLTGYKYSKKTAPRYTRALTSMIVERVKQQGWPRYKYVCNVMIGEAGGQCFDFSSRSLMFTETDTFATNQLKTETFFVVASVHACYFD